MYPSSLIYTKVSVVPCHPSNQENYHIFRKGLAKNTFTICNAKRLKPDDSTNVRKSFYKRTTLTGVLHRIRYKTNPHSAPTEGIEVFEGMREMPGQGRA